MAYKRRNRYQTWPGWWHQNSWYDATDIGGWNETIPSIEAFREFTFWKNIPSWFDSAICDLCQPSNLSNQPWAAAHGSKTSFKKKSHQCTNLSKNENILRIGKTRSCTKKCIARKNYVGMRYSGNQSHLTLALVGVDGFAHKCPKKLAAMSLGTGGK